MTKLMRRADVKASGLLLAFCLLFAGCGSKGRYMSAVETTAPQPASLSVVYDAPNGIFHLPRYDLVLKFDGGPRKSLKLQFLMDGEFTRVDGQTVQATVTRHDGMGVESDDALLSKLVESARITLKYVVEKDLRKYTQEVTHAYLITIALYDSNQRLLGEYRDRIVERTESQFLSYSASSSEAEPIVPALSDDPTAPSSIFHWIINRAARDRQ